MSPLLRAFFTPGSESEPCIVNRNAYDEYSVLKDVFRAVYKVRNIKERWLSREKNFFLIRNVQKIVIFVSDIQISYQIAIDYHHKLKFDNKFSSPYDELHLGCRSIIYSSSQSLVCDKLFILLSARIQRPSVFCADRSFR